MTIPTIGKQWEFWPHSKKRVESRFDCYMNHDWCDLKVFICTRRRWFVTLDGVQKHFNACSWWKRRAIPSNSLRWDGVELPSWACFFYIFHMDFHCNQIASFFFVVKESNNFFFMRQKYRAMRRSNGVTRILWCWVIDVRSWSLDWL